MPLTPLSEADEWTATVEVPSPGDLRKIASLLQALQSLTNRSKRARKGIPGIASTYQVDVPIAPIPRFSTAEGWSWDSSNSVYVVFRSGAGAHSIDFQLRLPPYGVLKEVHVVIGCGLLGSLPSVMPKFELWRTNCTIGAGGSFSDTQIGADAIDASADVTAYSLIHRVSLTGLTETIDPADAYTVRMTSDNGAHSGSLKMGKVYCVVSDS